MRLLKIIAIAVVALVGWSCGSLKYELLKGTSVPNPPTAPVKIYVTGFSVTSKANIVDPKAAVGSGAGGYSGANASSATNALASVGNYLAVISRPTRIEDLSGAIIRELRKPQVRVFNDLEMITGLEEIRLIDNPFELVAGSEDADLEIDGDVMLMSERVSKKFSQKTTSIEVQVSTRDMVTGSMSDKKPLRAGIRMIFNSRELEEAMAVAAITAMTQKILF